MKRLLSLLMIIGYVLGLFSLTEDIYKIIDTRKKEEINLSQLTLRLSKADVIFFGEHHDDSFHHEMEYKILEQIDQRGGKLAVSFEMFERDTQEILNQYLEGKIDEVTFLKKTRPWGNYETDYRPLLEYAKNHHLPVIASNVPRRYASLVNKGGLKELDSLSVIERGFIAKKIKAPSGEYRDMFYAVMSGNMGDMVHGNPMQNNMFESLYIAQCVKDETMAESITHFLKKNRHYKVIHFNGDFHSQYRLGTVERIPWWYKKRVITPIVIESGKELEYSKDDLKKGDFLIIHYKREIVEEKPIDSQAMFQTDNKIVKHEINIEIYPAENFLKAKDRVFLLHRLTDRDTLFISSDLTVQKVISGEQALDYEISKNEEVNYITFKNLGEINDLEFFYEGKIYHPVAERSLLQTHSFSRGIISDKEGEGIFLPANTWYPFLSNDIADFKVEAVCDTSFLLITSGKESRDIINTNYRYIWETELPNEGLILCGNRFKMAELKADSVKLRVYLLEDASSYSDRYLETLKTIYCQYSAMLGSYPFSSFSVVENFFPSGFGLPNYTVISSEVLKRPFITESPGVLAHEFVHNWWGNSVYNNDQGNWCEGLTSYCTNYYWNILMGDSLKATNFRYQIIKSFTLLDENKRYSLKDFMYQYNEEDAVIGYQKGTLFFIQLSDLIGAENLHSSLKEFSKLYRGKNAGWKDLFKVINYDSLLSGNEKGLEEVQSSFTDSQIPLINIIGYTYKENLLQVKIKLNPVIPSRIPIRIITNQEIIDEAIFSGRDSIVYFEKRLNHPLLSIEIDPEYRMIRLLNEESLPFTISTLLSRKPKLILPEESKTNSSQQMFANMLQQAGMISEAVYYKSEDSLSIENTIIIGNQENNPLFLKQDFKNLDLRGNQFIYDGDSYSLGQYDVFYADQENQCGYFYFSKEPSSYRRLLRYADFTLSCFAHDSDRVLNKTNENKDNPLKIIEKSEEK